jgi:2',3'-cyclic-nucleotide 2'-phosphodiesterase (5'-nucleotidase family)
LHSNDIHGRIEGLARIATLVAQTRLEHPDIPVLYLDAGDSEETSQRLSNLTKGLVMHRLLSVAGCDAATVGNGGLMRYGQHILKQYASVTRYPHLLANLRNSDGLVLEGAQATAILEVGSLKLGIIGLTAVVIDNDPVYERYFGLRSLPTFPLVSELATELRQQGADVVILLSHLGLHEDVMIPFNLGRKDELLPLIIGAHTHHLIPAGVWTSSITGRQVLIVQAGQYAEHLGRLDLIWTGERLQVERVSLISVHEAIAPLPAFQAELATIEAEVEQHLQEVISSLEEPLDLVADRECRAGNLMADALRERMQAEVGIVTAGVAFDRSLPAGPLTRIVLWEASSLPGNPGVVELTGAQFLQMVTRGLDPDLAADCPHSHRGRPRGLIHLSGASVRAGQLYIGAEPVDLARVYTVAASDWELDHYGGYVEDAWELKPTYDASTILREVVEEYLRGRPPIVVEMGRVDPRSLR